MSTQTELLREAVELLRAGHQNKTITAFLAKIDAAEGDVPGGFTLVENRALSTARMALAHATTTHGELYRDAYESLLAASWRQDGAR